MKVESILDRLRGARRNGNGCKAICPAHADKNPSLSVNEENGRVLLHCFAGCTVEAICAALRIKVSDLFTGMPARRKTEPRIVREAQRRISNFRSRLTPRDRELPVTVVLANEANLDAAIARALALAVEGELVQIAFDYEAQ